MPQGSDRQVWAIATLARSPNRRCMLQLRHARTRIAPMANPRTKKTAASTASLQTLLSEASRKATADLERVLRPKGVPVEYWRVLEVLADESGRSMSALAEAVSMRLPTLSKLIDRMVADALVQRAPDPQDLRRVLVYISD